MCDDDFDYPVSIFEGWRRARKAHPCVACHEAIRPGDRYHIEVQKYDRELREYKHCARCWAIVKALFASGAVSVQWDLNCGTPYEEAFGDMPERVARLAFLTPDEAQREAAKA